MLPYRCSHFLTVYGGALSSTDGLLHVRYSYRDTIQVVRLVRYSIRFCRYVQTEHMLTLAAETPVRSLNLDFSPNSILVSGSECLKILDVCLTDLRAAIPTTHHGDDTIA